MTGRPKGILELSDILFLVIISFKLLLLLVSFKTTIQKKEREIDIESATVVVSSTNELVCVLVCEGVCLVLFRQGAQDSILQVQEMANRPERIPLLRVRGIQEVEDMV